MASIGIFERIGDSDYLGDIFTLSLRAKNVRIVSVSRTNEERAEPPRLHRPGGLCGVKYFAEFLCRG